MRTRRMILAGLVPLLALGVPGCQGRQPGRSELLSAINANNVWTVRLLLMEGADPKDPDVLTQACGMGNPRILKLLLGKGAHINVYDSSGMMPLHVAMMSKRIEVARLLLARGADVRAKGARGWSSLHYAVASRNTELVELLLAEGLSANDRADDGATPLHIAARGGNATMATLLLAEGADPWVKTKKGRTPRDEAAYRVDLLRSGETVGGRKASDPGVIQGYAEVMSLLQRAEGQRPRQRVDE